MVEKKFIHYIFIFLALIHFNIAVTGACNRTCATIPVGNSPAGIAITPDNCFAYIANNDNHPFFMDNGIPGGSSVSVIDLRTNKLTKSITDAGFNEPYTVTINADGTRVYITNSNSTTISIIDTATNEVVGAITGFDGPSGMVITPDGKTAYVNNYGSPAGVGSGNATTVNIVNLTTNTISGTITVGLAPASLAITPDGAFVYVINYVDGNPGTGTISVIQTSDNTVVKTITGFFGPFAIAITPDGSFAYVTNFGSNNFSPTAGGIAPNEVSGTTVSAVNLSSNTVETTITLGNQPAGIAITPDGRFAYASNYNTFYLGPNFTDLTAGKGTVNVIDICTNKVLCPVLVVGASPSAIAISCDGQRAYVTNYTSNDVTVINIMDRMWLNVCC